MRMGASRTCRRPTPSGHPPGSQARGRDALRTLFRAAPALGMAVVRRDHLLFAPQVHNQGLATSISILVKPMGQIRTPLPSQVAGRMEQLPGWNNYLGSNLRPQTTRALTLPIELRGASTSDDDVHKERALHLQFRILTAQDIKGCLCTVLQVLKFGPASETGTLLGNLPGGGWKWHGAAVGAAGGALVSIAIGINNYWWCGELGSAVGAMVDGLRRGDQVVTQGGLIGKVSKVKEDNEIEVELAEGVKVRVVKSTVAQVLNKTEPAK